MSEEEISPRLQPNTGWAWRAGFPVRYSQSVLTVKIFKDYYCAVLIKERLHACPFPRAQRRACVISGAAQAASSLSRRRIYAFNLHLLLYLLPLPWGTKLLRYSVKPSPSGFATVALLCCSAAAYCASRLRARWRQASLVP